MSLHFFCHSSFHIFFTFAEPKPPAALAQADMTRQATRVSFNIPRPANSLGTLLHDPSTLQPTGGNVQIATEVNGAFDVTVTSLTPGNDYVVEFYFIVGVDPNNAESERTSVMFSTRKLSSTIVYYRIP